MPEGNTKLVDLEQQLQDLKQENQNLKLKLLAAEYDLKKTKAKDEQQHSASYIKELLDKDLLSPKDWTEAYFIPFVDDLEAFELIEYLQYRGDTSTPTTWAETLKELLLKLEKQTNGLQDTNGLEQTTLKEAKKQVIALWVYLQWLDLHSMTAEPDHES